MAETLPFLLVDAFAESAFSGNPAGVVLSADRLSTEQMQLIAREVNASETAFISGASDLHRPPRLRWFTPTVEAGFCGHATLAAAHAVGETTGWDALRAKCDGVLQFESQAGMLRVKAESPPRPDAAPLWWLSMPDPSLRADNTNPMRTCELLGIRIDDLDPAAPPMRTRDDDVILLLRSWQTLVEMKPDFHSLGEWSRRHRIRGFCCATTHTLSESVNVASRFFGPAVGIPEDPVTGSVHGPLGVYLATLGMAPLVGGRASLTCVQGIPGGRTGLIRVLVEATGSGYRVHVGGTCHVTVAGEVRVPV